MKRFMAVAFAFALGICGLVLAEEYQELASRNSRSISCEHPTVR